MRLAHYRFLDRRSAESLVLCWTICEVIIDHLWNTFLDEVKAKDQSRMSNRRKNGFENPAAYTASIKSEILELVGKISINQLKSLNSVRNLRNSWLHRMNDIHTDQAWHAIEVCIEMISKVYEIEIAFASRGPGGTGGGMFLDVFQRHLGEVDLSTAYDGSSSQQ